jgi:hypothetical protein
MKTRIILTKEEKRRNKLIDNVQKSIKELQQMNYKIKTDINVETMAGNILNHVYLYDTLGTRIILQKHLFSY